MDRRRSALGRRHRPSRIVLAMLLATAMSACSSNDNQSDATLDVLAASSLTESFTELGTMFEASRRGVTVSFGFGASSALAEQIKAGAPGNVFASADTQSMDEVVAAGRVAAGPPAAFATNRLSIIVAKDNPKAITGLADLARRGLVVVLCAPEVPCGRLAKAALARQHVAVEPASLEQNVKAVTTKVVLGEADAGIVYETDVRAAGTKALGVMAEGADHPALQATYVIARLADADADDVRRDLADEWVTFVRSPEAQKVFARFGFGGP